MFFFLILLSIVRNDEMARTDLVKHIGLTRSFTPYLLQLFLARLNCLMEDQ